MSNDGVLMLQSIMGNMSRVTQGQVCVSTYIAGSRAPKQLSKETKMQTFGIQKPLRLRAHDLIKASPGILGKKLHDELDGANVSHVLKDDLANGTVVTRPLSTDKKQRMYYMAGDAPLEPTVPKLETVEPTRVRAPELQDQAVANMASTATETLTAPELPMTLNVLEAPVIDIDKVYETLNIPKPTTITETIAEPKTKPFRIAYTNDGCLMLMGLNDYGMPLELTPAQTKDLVGFVYGMDLEAQA